MTARCVHGVGRIAVSTTTLEVTAQDLLPSVVTNRRQLVTISRVVKWPCLIRIGYGART